MEVLRISGGTCLKGDVQISGSKNAALPQFAATLLSNEKSILKNIPDLSDVRFMGEILSELGLIGYILFGLFFYISISHCLKTYAKSKNLFQLSSLLFVISTIIPLLPSGSFFTTYTASIFWVNYGLLFYKKS